MYLSIPSCQEIVHPETGDRHLFYNIHINGTQHCAVRFSSLLQLHEQLKREFGGSSLETFPPKKALYVDLAHADERRLLLQRWLQRIGKNTRLLFSPTFQTFLLNAQKEMPEEDEEVELHVHLMNGKSVKIEIISSDQTDDVLETLCGVLGIKPEHTFYFGLYLVHDIIGNSAVRRLQEFESPYVTLKREPHELQLRRAYWNPDTDSILYDDPIALNLLYIEVISDLRNNLVTCDAQTSEALKQLRTTKDRQAFIDLARKQTGYASMKFPDSSVKLPQETEWKQVTLTLAYGKLIAHHAGGVRDEYEIARMAAWRSCIDNDIYELEFDYLFVDPDGEDADNTTVVSVRCGQIIHLAMHLQYIAEEMARAATSKPIKIPADRLGTFRPRRQGSRKMDMSFLTSDHNDSAGPGDQKLVISMSNLVARSQEEV